MEKKNRNLNKIIPFLLVFSFIFMSIGYASINSITSTISGDVVAEAQEGVFITSVVYSSGDQISESNSYYGTLLHNNIELSTNNDSSITYQITVYNNTSIDYAFVKTTIENEFYTNDGISYKLTDIELKDIMEAYSYITFYITFYYTDSEYTGDSSLESYINFEFAYADSYCEVNGVSSLSKCLVSNDSKTDYDTSVANIIGKGTPDYSKTAPVSTYEEKTSNGTLSLSTSQVYVGTSYDFDPDSGAYTLTDGTLTFLTDLDLNDGNTYYTTNTSSTSAYSLYEIKAINDTKVNVVTHSQSAVNSSGSSGLYVTTDYDGEDTYYYRGEVEDNWVSFAGFLWRVVRINSDGSIRMIYSGEIDASSHTGSYSLIRNSNNTISSTYSHNAYKYGATYVGYMYNPELVVSSTPSYTLKAEDSESNYTLSSFSTFSGITNSTYYYFFNDFDLSNCDTSTGTCTMSCTNFDSNTNTGSNCIYSTWNSLKNNEDNYTTDTSYGSTSSYYYYTNEYKYSCFDIGEVSEDGSTVTVSCPIVNEVLGVVKSSSTQVKSRFHGLFSSSYESAITNVEDSNVKYEVDYWYSNNIAGTEYEKYLADEIFCSDRSYETGNGYNFDVNENTKYSSYYRNDSEKSPSLTCTNSGDIFTVSSGTLTYPIGLITADEVALAGGVFGSINYNYYLSSGTWYWTMTPAYFNSSSLDSRVVVVNATGNITVNSPSSTLGIRPVINLSSSVLYVSGVGTEDDPYVVGISS